MRISTMKGIAAGSLVGMTLGAGLMMTPQGKRMKKVLAKKRPDDVQTDCRLLDKVDHMKADNDCLPFLFRVEGIAAM